MSVRFPKPYTFRSERYLKFVRSLPCCVCGTNLEVEAHHTETGGMGIKCADTKTVSICHKHHMELHALGRKSFALKHEVIFTEEVLKCLEKFVQSILEEK